MCLHSCIAYSKISLCLSVAIQCLENVYEISAEDASPLPASLQVIFDKGLEQLGGVRELPAAEPALSQKPVDKEKAEKCKAEGEIFGSHH